MASTLKHIKFIQGQCIGNNGSLTCTCVPLLLTAECYARCNRLADAKVTLKEITETEQGVQQGVRTLVRGSSNSRGG